MSRVIVRWLLVSRVVRTCVTGIFVTVHCVTGAHVVARAPVTQRPVTKMPDTQVRTTRDTSNRRTITHDTDNRHKIKRNLSDLVSNASDQPMTSFTSCAAIKSEQGFWI